MYCEQQPLRFLDRELLPHLVWVIRRLAKFIGVGRVHVCEEEEEEEKEEGEVKEGEEEDEEDDKVEECTCLRHTRWKYF